MPQGNKEPMEEARPVRGVPKRRWREMSDGTSSKLMNATHKSAVTKGALI